MAEYECADDCTDDPIPTPKNLLTDVSHRGDQPHVFLWDVQDYLAQDPRVVPVFRRATKRECEWVRDEMREARS